MENSKEPPLSPLQERDQNYEEPLRPQRLYEFSGQAQILERLDVFIRAAKERKDVLRHALFSGPPGLGKSTLAAIVAREMGANLVTTSGPILEKPSDLAGILTNLQPGDVLFIDEIHRLNRVVEEYLYPAMEDYTLDLIIDSGPHARSVQVKLNPFSLIGATTKQGLLTAPMRSRFALNFRLDFYQPETLKEIVKRSAAILKTKLNDKAALEIAKRSRGTPRIANNLFRWMRDYAQIKANGVITEGIVEKASKMLAIDDKGLDEIDKKILFIIIDHYNGGPVGLNTLAVALGEESSTLEEVYEPYLIMQGFIKRTSRGREVTALAYEHLKNKNKVV
ncbi:MAG: Holliday junction ATP-dependent DNA helicase RuvB [Chlamydiae bacterium]|nr:Holliday junction ATP-dependent DNA helicase RuvB [Chlamydiota bacterium]